MFKKGKEVKELKTAYDTVRNRVAKLKEEGKEPMYIHALMVMDDKKFFKAIKETVKSGTPVDEAAIKVGNEFSEMYAEKGGDLMSKGAKFDGEEIAKEFKGVENK